MAIATFCSRILGLVREQVLAFYFGASGFTDAFLIAYRIPNLLRDLFAEGAFSAAFVPVFVEARGISQEEARKLLWKLFILLGVVTLTIGVITFVFAPEIVNLFAPTFYKDPEKFELTVLLTRIMSPFLCFVSIAALFMGALNSLKVFFIPSLAPAFFNVTMILSMLIFPSYLIAHNLNPIVSVALGVFIGGLVQAFVQIPLIYKKGFGPRRTGPLLTYESKKVFKKLGPGLVGFAATQLNLLVNTILASMSAVGAVSWLSYAFRLFQLPVGILSVSIGNSNLVHFSDAWKRKDYDEAREYLASSYFMSLFIVLPAMAALIIFSDEMINVIFERGQFSHFSTEQTAKALRWYALGLPFYSIYKIFVPTFYTIDREKIPVLCSMGSVAFNIVFCVTLAPEYGFEILALGTTLSIMLNSFMQGLILKKDIQLAVNTYINLRVFKILLSLFITSGLAFYLKQQFDFMSHSFAERCLLLAGYLFVVAASYFFFAILFGERSLVIKVIRKFMRK
tara:strand:- start:1741 stop:3267 length:1527 start_codon:yes stop_codon:yes gene_type:complete